MPGCATPDGKVCLGARSNLTCSLVIQADVFQTLFMGSFNGHHDLAFRRRARGLEKRGRTTISLFSPIFESWLHKD